MQNFKWFLVILVVILLGACTNDSEVDVEGEESSTSEKTGDVVVGFDQDLSTIDPHGTNDVIGI